MQWKHYNHKMKDTLINRTCFAILFVSITESLPPKQKALGTEGSALISKVPWFQGLKVSKREHLVRVHECTLILEGVLISGLPLYYIINILSIKGMYSHNSKVNSAWAEWSS